MKSSNSARASTVCRVIRTWHSTLTLRPSCSALASRTVAPSTPSFSSPRTRRHTEAGEAPTRSDSMAWLKLASRCNSRTIGRLRPSETFLRGFRSR